MDCTLALAQTWYSLYGGEASCIRVYVEIEDSKAVPAFLQDETSISLIGKQNHEMVTQDTTASVKGE